MTPTPSEVRPRLRGVLAPIVTPFDTALAVDVPRFLTHGHRLLAQGASLTPFGTTSESHSLSSDEQMDLLDRMLADGMPADRMMPGTGTCAIPETVRLSAHAASRGCAGVLMLPPFYYKGVSDEGLFRYFSEVIQRVGDARLRVYLYHIPPMAVVGISPALVERLLAAYPATVVGMKDSSNDWQNTLTFLQAFASGGFDVFAGSDTWLLATMRHQGAGCISATVNINAPAIVRLYREWTQPDAAVQQAALDQVRSLMARQTNIIAALKATIAAATGDPGWHIMRPPLVELSDDARQRLATDLADTGWHWEQA